MKKALKAVVNTIKMTQPHLEQNAKCVSKKSGRESASTLDPSPDLNRFNGAILAMIPTINIRAFAQSKTDIAWSEYADLRKLETATPSLIDCPIHRQTCSAAWAEFATAYNEECGQ